MPSNVVSNYANVAPRSLLKTDTEASASLAELPISKRVVSADRRRRVHGDRLS
jgi:hypothetical protein